MIWIGAELRLPPQPMLPVAYEPEERCLTVFACVCGSCERIWLVAIDHVEGACALGVAKLVIALVRDHCHLGDVVLQIAGSFGHCLLDGGIDAVAQRAFAPAHEQNATTIGPVRADAETIAYWSGVTS